MSKFPMWIVVSLLTFIGCKKKATIDNPPTPTYNRYSMLETGNYWIYERFQIKTDGSAVPLGIFDSCYVEKDTLINNNTYHIINRPNPWGSIPERWIVRDSLHYMVSNMGHIMFSSEDFKTTFSTHFSVIDIEDPITHLPVPDTVAKVTTKMTDRNALTSVPYGILTTSDFITAYQMYPKYAMPENPRYEHRRFSKGIGMVSETLHFFTSNPEYTERRLVRFLVK